MIIFVGFEYCNSKKSKQSLKVRFSKSSFNPIDLFSSVNDVFSGYIGKTYFHLSHYSHRVWPGSHKGSIHLFGHSHGSLVGDFGKSMDVGIDCHPEFRPYHLNEILQIMSKKTIESVDHH